MEVKTERSSAVVIQYVLCAVAWGASFLFIKIGLEGLSPTQVVLGRLLSGAAALAVVCVVAHRPLPRDRRIWQHMAVVSVMVCVLPFLLFAWAEESISSGLASIYNATTPLLTMLVALLVLPEERPTRVRLLGLLLGFAGVVVVLGPWQGLGDGTILAQLACLGATSCYGIAFVYFRRLVVPLSADAIGLATLQVGLAAVLLGVLSPWVAAEPVDLSWRVVLSILALGVLGTGLAFVWNANVVIRWGATAASSVTYLTPVVGVLLGTVVLSESVRWHQPVGAVVVIAGILLSRAGTGRVAPVTEPRR